MYAAEVPDEIAPLRDGIRDVLGLEGFNEDSPFMREATSDGFLSLRPSGVDSAEWQVFASILPSSDTPVINALVDYWHLRHDNQRLRDDVISGRLDESDPPISDHELDRLFIRRYRDPSVWEDLLRDYGILAKTWDYLGPILEDFPDMASSNVPIPVFPLCQLRLEHGFSVMVNDDVSELEVRTLEVVRAQGLPVIEHMDDLTVVLTPEGSRTVDILSAYASRSIRDMLGASAPILRCRVPVWPHAQPFTWEASFDGGERWLPYHALSAGHCRWAATSTRLAIVQFWTEIVETLNEGFMPLWHTLLLIDEPERGLPPSIENRVFDGLSQLPQSVSVIMSTHSTVPLTNPNFEIWFCGADGTTPSSLTQVPWRVRQMTTLRTPNVSHPSIDSGPAPVVLFIDNEIDEAVIQVFLEDLCRAGRVVLINVNDSTQNCSALTSYILHFSRARICVTLKNDAHPAAVKMWKSTALETESRGSFFGKTLFREITGDLNDVSLFAHVGDVVVSAGEPERLLVTGWGRPSVLHDLPVSDFLTQFSSWADVEESGIPGESIYETVSRLRDSPLTVNDVLASLGRLSTPPDDLLRLADFVRSLVVAPWFDLE